MLTIIHTAHNCVNAYLNKDKTTLTKRTDSAIHAQHINQISIQTLKKLISDNL